MPCLSENRNIILIIDDDEFVRLSFRDFLEDSDFQIIEAENGEEGLRLFRKKSPGLVLLDLRMPGMDGLEVLTELKCISPDTPVIVVSGAGIIEDVVAAMHLGAWDYILKPVENLTVLLHSIKKSMERSLLIQENRSYQKHLEKEKEILESQLFQSQKMESIGTLAGGIAHDFNNILSSIIGYTELTMVNLDEEGREKSHLASVLRAADRAKALVGQILAFSRQSEQVCEPVLVHLVIEEALKLLRASLPASIEIKQNIANSGSILADPAQVHQVIMNLCTNSFQAMEANGGILKVNLEQVTLDEQTTINIRGLDPGHYVKLIVEDNGCGMNQATIDRIFDPYFTTKSKGKGTGLGLAVVHGIVKSNRGAILVDSGIGQGTRFTVFLPVIHRDKVKEMSSEEFIPRGTEKILLIDDEKEIIDIEEKMLTKLGYDVTTSISSLEALDIFKTNPMAFDAVITDMTMPHMTGDTLARSLLEIRPGVPVILCTGFSEQVDEDTAIEIGIKKFVFKPIYMKELAKSLREVLEYNEHS